MGRWPLASILLSVLVVGEASAQTPGPAADSQPDRFEAASIHLNPNPRGSHSANLQRGGRFVAVAASPLLLINAAYGYEDYLVFGAPAWASSEHYDVNAVPNPAATQLTRVVETQMLRNLLKDRFGLVVHTERRSMDTYALVREKPGDKLGPALHPSTVDCKAFLASGRTPPTPEKPADFERIPTCGRQGGTGLLAAGGITMGELAWEFHWWLHASVVDRTGLSGGFDVILKWNQDPLNTASDPSLPVLTTAVQEQLGLKLERRVEPIDVLVIDRIHRPDEN
jgi:uncharacterized protein (TIGR03435 family)